MRHPADSPEAELAGDLLAVVVRVEAERDALRVENERLTRRNDELERTLAEIQRIFDALVGFFPPPDRRGDQ